MFIFPLLLSSCATDSQNEINYIIKSGWYFGTQMSVTLFDSSEEVMNHVLEIFSEYSTLTDAYNAKADSNLKEIVNIYYINKDENEGKEIEVDSRLASLLSFGLEMREKTCINTPGQIRTDYYFNPLIGKLSTLWKNFVDDPASSFPSNETITELLDEMNSSSLEVNGNIVKRSGKGKIDVGAYAKGYVVKVVQDYLKEEGVDKYSINGGSSSLGLGTTSDGGEYKITLSSLKEKGYSEAYFKLKDSAVGTSGISEQGKKYDGKTYSHIVNPNNGSGLAKYDTVSIIASDAGLADILSTAIFVGGEELAKVLQSSFSFEYMIFDGENVIQSSNFNLVLEK